MENLSDGQPVKQAARAVLPIGEPQIQQALTILDKYRQGKETLDQRIVENEQWYRDRYWEPMSAIQERDKADKKQINPVSAWLFNSVENKHADAMDNIPCANVLAVEQDDEQVAKLLSSVVPAILRNDSFESTYSDLQRYRLKFGTGLYGVFWDKSKLNGLGDVVIRKCDILNLFWKDGVSDIQDSPNLFYVTLEDNDALMADYPEQLAGVTLGGGGDAFVKSYAFDKHIDIADQTAVIDWYYKRRVGGKTVVHLCKFAAGRVLFASENMTAPGVDSFGGMIPPMAEAGYYDHGLYPFVMDPLFTVEKSPCGLSYVDIAKFTQDFIDKGDRAILQNMLANSKPRYFMQADKDFNEEDFLDTEKSIVTVEGLVDDTRIKPIIGVPLPPVFYQIYQGKIEELKEVTGNRDASTGGTSSGVTAYAAIAAMQEAGSKLSRDANKASYRAFEQVVKMVIELIRQFYDLPRFFRIAGKRQAYEYIVFDNRAMKPRAMGDLPGITDDTWSPQFDLEITASKQSSYSRMAQNELAVQLYQMGIFNPQNSIQAVSMLDMMDFNGKDAIIQKIRDNGMAFNQQMVMLAMSAMGGGEGQPVGGGQGQAAGGQSQTAGGQSRTESKPRQRAAEASSPR